MVYKYLYQTKQNNNCEGEIKARNRAEAYALLRKQGIRPYRVIGDDPWNWRPWAIAGGYALLLMVLVVMAFLLGAKSRSEGKEREKASSEKIIAMTPEEAIRFREKAEEAVYRAPEQFRYNVWKGVNARLKERGLDPIELPEGISSGE